MDWMSDVAGPVVRGYGVLLRPLPYPGAAALRHVAKRVAGPDGEGWDALRIEEFHALRERSRVFTRVAAYGFETYNAVHDGAPPRRLIGGAISGEFFAVLGVAPALGRGITAGEDQPGQPMKAVLSDGLSAVEAACLEALREGVHSADVIINILARRRELEPPATITTPDALRLRYAPSADCARYDSLRRVH